MAALGEAATNVSTDRGSIPRTSTLVAIYPQVRVYFWISGYQFEYRIVARLVPKPKVEGSSREPKVVSGPPSRIPMTTLLGPYRLPDG